MPCRPVPMSGKGAHVFVARSNITTLLRTCPADNPPTATRRPSAMATPRSLRPWGRAGNDVQVLAPGSYASTFVRSEFPLVPPTAYISLPSDAPDSICRAVGMSVPRVQEFPSKISVVFTSAPFASTPPVTMMRSPTTAAAAAARGSNMCGSSTQRLLTTRQTRSVTSLSHGSPCMPPRTTGFPCHVTDIAC